MTKTYRLKTDLALNYIALDEFPIDWNKVVVIFLHGRESNELDLIELVEKIPGPIFPLSVRAPIQMGADSYGWFRTSYPETGAPIHDAIEAKNALVMLEKFIDQVRTKYEPSKVILIGFSQGAILSFGILLKSNAEIEGMVAMSGRILPEHSLAVDISDRTRNTPVLIQHGLRDAILDIEYAFSAQQFLDNWEMYSTLQKFDMGHDVTDASFSMAVEWLKVRSLIS